MNNKDLIKLYWIKFCKNAVALICFTIIAIVFNHWWIIFFSVIFIGDDSLNIKIKGGTNEKKIK